MLQLMGQNMLKLLEKKRVHWQDDEAQKVAHEFLPQFKKRKSALNFNKLKMQVISILLKEDYREVLSPFINEVFANCPEKKEEFFNSNGQDILSYLLTCSKEVGALQLIRDLFGVKALGEAVEKENFKCLRMFLSLQSGQEMMAQDTLSIRELRVEQCKFLLSINHLAIKKYFGSTDAQEYLTKKIQEDFAKAHQELSSNCVIPGL